MRWEGKGEAVTPLSENGFQVPGAARRTAVEKCQDGRKEAEGNVTLGRRARGGASDELFCFAHGRLGRIEGGPWPRE